MENIQSSKLYSPILKDGGRCVIVVEGFYEWQTTNKTSKTKQPYYIYAPQDESIKVGYIPKIKTSFTLKKYFCAILACVVCIVNLSCT